MFSSKSSCDFSPRTKRIRLLTADFGLNAFSVWFALITILSETVYAVVQNLVNSSNSQAAIDAVTKVVGNTDNLSKLGDALGGSISGSTISGKSKYALTFAVATIAMAVQALLAIIFLYLATLLLVMYLSPQSRQQKLTGTLRDWYEQEKYWNGPFLHPRISRGLIIKSFACVVDIIIVIFGLAIVPNASVAFGAVAFPFIQTIVTILNCVPSTPAICASVRSEVQNDDLRDSILSFELKELPEISALEMVTRRTADLLARGEAYAMYRRLDVQPGLCSVKASE